MKKQSDIPQFKLSAFQKKLLKVMMDKKQYHLIENFGEWPNPIPDATMPIRDSSICAMENKGILVNFSKNTPIRGPFSVFVLSDNVRAYLANQSLEDFQAERFAKLREILSGPKNQENFKEVIRLLAFSDINDEWQMLFDYAEQQLNDWDDLSRTYRRDRRDQYSIRQPAFGLVKTMHIAKYESGNTSDYMENAKTRAFFALEAGDVGDRFVEAIDRIKDIEELILPEHMAGHFFFNMVRYAKPRHFTNLKRLRIVGSDKHPPQKVFGPSIYMVSFFNNDIPPEYARYCFVNQKVELIDLSGCTYLYEQFEELRSLTEQLRSLTQELKLPVGKTN